MEILRDPCSPPVLLSNAEVLKVLELQDARNRNELLQDSSKSSNGTDADGNITKSHKVKKQKIFYKRRDWIQQETLMYLKNSPCSSLDVERINELKSKFCTNHSTSTSMNSTDGSKKDENIDRDYSLTEAEMIQVMNMMPQGSVVDVHLLVAEAHTRIGDEKKVEKFLDTLNKYRKSTP